MVENLSPQPCIRQYAEFPDSPVIYKIVCTANAKIYVGSTRTMRKRMRAHLGTLSKGKHSSILMQRNFDKYGVDAFTVEVLEAPAIGQLIEREAYWFDILKPYDRAIGMNISKVPAVRSAPHSEETKRKIGAANLGKTKGLAERAAVSQRFELQFAACSPDGEIYEGKNLLQFCVTHQLDYRGLCGVKRGAERQWRGWFCAASRKELTERLKARRKNERTYEVQTPEGEVITITNFTEFCNLKGLSLSAMRAVSYGRFDNHKGYRIRNISHPVKYGKQRELRQNN